MSLSSSTRTLALLAPTSTSVIPSTLSPPTITSSLSIDESNLIHTLSLLSESYRPPMLDLIVLSLAQSSFSIEVIEKIYLEDIVTLGCRFVEQNESFRIRQELEILRNREERRLRLENIEIRRESFKSRVENYVLNIELIKIVVQFKSWFVDFGNVWKEDALSNWKVVKKQLKRMEVSFCLTNLFSQHIFITDFNCFKTNDRSTTYLASDALGGGQSSTPVSQNG